MLTNKPSYYATISIFALVILYAADRMAKLGFVYTPEIIRSVLSWLPLSEEVVYNPGIFLGLQIPQTITIFTSTVLLLIVLYYLLKAVQNEHIMSVFGWGLIFIGGGSNLMDRIIFGVVVDWLIMPWHAVINLADVYITVGIILLVIYIVLLQPQNTQKEGRRSS
ncbi:MAG: signal peptidase II [Patescibacteria group bacterium]